MAYSNSWVNNTPNTSLAVVTSPTAHDVLIAWAKTDSGTTTFTWPSGFTEIGTQFTSADGCMTGVAIKNDASGSEGSLTISCPNNCVGGVIAYSGRDNTTPQAFTASITNNNTGTASPWTLDSNSVTPSADGTDIFALLSDDVTGFRGNVAHSFATFSGTTGAWTVRQDPTTSDGGYDYGVGTATQVTAGAITVRGTGTEASESAGRSLFVVGLKPSGGGGTSVALTGQAATGAGGTLAISANKALTGQAATASGGTATPTLALALTGQQASTSQGSVAPTATVPMTGLAATGAQGAVTPTITVPLTGLSVTLSQGTLSPDTSSDTNVALTGRAATASGGTLAPAADKALSGLAGTAQQGTATPAMDKALSGQSATSAGGSVTPSVSVALTGLQASTQQGTLTPNVAGNVTIALTGLSMAMSQGTLSAVAPSVSSAGFWGANPQRVRRITDEERKEAVRKEREALGILPKPVQNIVRKLAKELDSFDPDEEISQRLEAALKARDQAYLERAESVLRSMLKREREEMEEEEEALFLLM
jgi:hypothetical protein